MTKKKKKKIKGNKLSSRQLQSELLKFFRYHSTKQFNPRQIIKKLKIENNKDSVQYALDQLAESGSLVRVDEYRYRINAAKLPSQNGEQGDRKTYQGKVDMTRSGDAYILVDGLEHDVHVSAKYVNGALNGDVVDIRTWRPRGRHKLEGEIIRVVERAHSSFLGTLQRFARHAVVVTDSSVPIEIRVATKDLSEAQHNDKVVVTITEWEHPRYKQPVGEITAVLGAAGSHDIEMKSILINNGFDLEFPKAVIEETKHLLTNIPDAEIALRRDVREITTFTIDPDNAKDFDDALSFRRLEDGKVEIGVHIADVSYYVRPGTALDQEAYARSTSVYLVDRVLPMLPEKLSNELCSLRPNEDSLTFSAIFVFDEKERVIERWFGRTIIHSDRRFTYDEVQAILEAGQGEYIEELNKLNAIAQKMRKQRFRKGSINFETDEVKFRLDEDGTPLEVYVKERKDAHLLIEDFMLLANREVATYIEQKGKEKEVPFVYRIHDEPDPDKVEDLVRFAAEMGYSMNIQQPKDVAKAYNELAKAAEKNQALKLLEPIAIRTMAKAVYSTDNIGHYGLGFDNYTHFTSPIRRYSDVLVHRILERNLGEGNFFRVNKVKLEDRCKHISNMERNAQTAERESIKYKQVEFMEKHIGEVFTGLVSGIAEFGIFIELVDNRCEGMIPFELMDQPYEVDSSRLRIKGRRTGRIIRRGDSLEVQIVKTDLQRRRIDMALVDDGEVVVKAGPSQDNKQKPRKQGGRAKSTGRSGRKPSGGNRRKK
jgi:ribonuclease R